MAFNGVGDGTDENVAIDLAFDEIILGAFTDGFDRHGFVVGSAQDDHGHSRSLCAESLERVQALAVGQGQIRKDDIELFVAQLCQCLGEARDAGPCKIHGLALAEEQLEQARIDGAIFHQ